MGVGQTTFDPLDSRCLIPDDCLEVSERPKNRVHAPGPTHGGNLGLDRIVRLPELREITGLSRSSIYRMIDKGEFPRALILGPNSRGWRASAIAAWMDSLELAGPGTDEKSTLQPSREPTEAQDRKGAQRCRR